MIRLLTLLLLLIASLMADTILLNHPQLKAQAEEIGAFLSAHNHTVEIKPGIGPHSENLALVGLKTEGIFAATLSLPTLRSIMPELKFVTDELDETDIAILENSLASAGLVLLASAKAESCLCVLVSGIRPGDPLYPELMRHLKKI